MNFLSQKTENNLLLLAYIAFLLLGAFVFISLSFSASYHILIIVPGIYFTFKYLKEYGTKIPLSMIGLVLVCVTAFLSIAANYDDMGGLGSAFKLKYFFISLISIAPAFYFFKDKYEVKYAKILFNTFFFATAIANIAGLIALKTGFNYLRFKAACHQNQACGMYGMTITYGYNVELLCLLFVGLFVYRKKIQHLWNEKLFYFSLIAAHLGLYFSFSRGALLGYLVAFPLVFLAKNRKLLIRSYLLSGLALVGILFAIWQGIRPGFLSRYTLSFTDSSNMERIGMWQAAVAAFQDNPVFGIGFRNFEKHSYEIKKKYGFIDFKQFKGHAHNNYLEFLAGCGILGFLSLLIFHFGWGIELLRAPPDLASILLPVFVGFAFSGLFQSTIIDGENMFFIMGLYSLFTALVLFHKEETEKSN